MTPILLSFAILVLAQPRVSTELGDIHFEESYHILHGKLDVRGTKNILTSLEKFGWDLINATVSFEKMPNAKSLQRVIGYDINEKTKKMRRELDSATFSIDSTKRGIDFLGDWLHQLTGVVGPYQHEKEVSAISHIKSVLSSQEEFNLNIHDGVSKIVKKIEKEDRLIIDTRKHLNDMYAKLEDENSDLIKCVKLMALKVQIDAKTNAIAHRINDYNFILLEAKTHHLSSRLINATMLKSKIKEISADSRDLTPIIPYDKASAYYALPTTRAVLIRKNVHIFTRIPMIRPDQSMQLHAIDYKTEIEHGHAIQDFDYLLTNKKMSHFSTMTNEQLIRAIKIPGLGLLTDIRPIEIEINVKNCSTVKCTSLISHITQIRENTFAYRLPEETNAKTFCMKNDSTTNEKIPMRGTLVLGPDCTMRSKYFLIHKVLSHDNSAFLSYSQEIKLNDLTTIFSKTEIHEDNMKQFNSSITFHNDTLETHIDTLNQIDDDLADLNVTSYKNEKTLRDMKTDTDAISMDQPLHWGFSIGALTTGIVCFVAIITLGCVLYCARLKIKLIKRDARLALARNKELREEIELNDSIRSGLAP